MRMRGPWWSQPSIGPASVRISLATTLKPLPCSPGRRCLDRGIQCQEVRLVRDLGNDRHDFADLEAVFRKLREYLQRSFPSAADGIHHLHRVVQRSAALIADLDGVVVGGGNLLRALRRLSEVFNTSSTLVTVWATAEDCSRMPSTCCVVPARISAADDERCCAVSEIVASNFSSLSLLPRSLSIIPASLSVIALKEAPRTASSSLPSTDAFCARSPALTFSASTASARVRRARPRPTLST